MNSAKPMIPVDMNPSSVSSFASYLGVMPNELQVYCSSTYAGMAQKVMEEWGCPVVFLPPEFLSSPYAWGVRQGNQFMWTEGVT